MTCAHGAGEWTKKNCGDLLLGFVTRRWGYCSAIAAIQENSMVVDLYLIPENTKSRTTKKDIQ
jgi:hypothetical protein